MITMCWIGDDPPACKMLLPMRWDPGFAPNEPAQPTTSIAAASITHRLSTIAILISNLSSPGCFDSRHDATFAARTGHGFPPTEAADAGFATATSRRAAA